MSVTWVVIGASSAIARAFAREAARRGHGLLLCGRDAEDLRRIAADCRIRGADSAETLVLDLGRATQRRRLADRLVETPGPLGIALFAGRLPDQAALDADPDENDPGAAIADTLTGPVALMQTLAPLLEARGGTLLALGSVAGERGRPENHVYGAAKAGLHVYLQGLRARLAGAGVSVITVKPGPVDTAMTWGMDLPVAPAAPATVARDCWRAIDRGRAEVYSPGFWRWIMMAVRVMPAGLLRRLTG